MRLRLLTACLSLFVTGSAAGAGQLLSIVNLDLADDQFVAHFKVRVDNGNVRAVCRIPLGWSVAGVSEANGDSELVGGILVGAAALNRHSIDALEAMFVLDDPDPKRGGRTEFEGKVLVGVYATDIEGKERPLSASNFVLRPAERCP